MAGLRVPAGALRWAVIAGIALLCATPFVVTPGTLFPFVVGKAVWTRSIIEIVFALWAVLALARPEYRPPRSWLLLLLGAGLAVALLAAGFGVSVQRSLWSSYERMQGVVDLAHWAALAVVLASVLRTGAEWRALLAVNAGASTALACLVVAGHFQLDVPFFGALPEPHRPRMGGPIGNPTYLAVCMLFNLVVAAGFAARAWLPAAAPAAAPAPLPKGGGRRRRRHAPAQPTGRRRRRWIGGPAWTAVAALHLWVLGLAGSVGGFVGLFAGIAFAAVSSVLLGRGAGRWRAVAALALLAAAAVGAGVRFVAAERPAASRFERPLVRYVATVHLLRPGVQGRLAAWETGVEGFARRPLLGWGPENFDTVFGRFASGYGAVAQPHDHAHGKLVEVAATSGALGVAAYLALWSWTFLVVWRAARGLERRERALAVGAGAALAGGLVQSQFLFDTAVGSLQTIVLLGFVAHLEAIALPAARRPRLPAPLSGAWAGLLRRRGARVVLGAAAVAVAAGGLATQQAIYAAAHLRHLPAAVLADAGARLGSDAAGSLRVMTGGIDGFRPLANTYRWWLFDTLARHWPRLRAVDAAGAARLLAWAEREIEAVVRTEPESWRIHHSVTRMYHAAAATDPAYGDRGAALPATLARARAQPGGVSAPPGAARLACGAAARRRPPRAALALVGGCRLPRDRRVARRWRLVARVPRLRSRRDVVRGAQEAAAGHLALPRQGVPLPRRLQRLGRMAAHRRAPVTVRDHCAASAPCAAGRGASSMPASAGCQPGRTVSAWARNSASSASQVCRSPWRTST